MSIIGWIVLGLVAGLIGSNMARKHGRGFIPDIILGIAGAILGGIVFTKLSGTDATRFSMYSMMAAVIGSVVVLLIYHAVFGRGRNSTI